MQINKTGKNEQKNWSDLSHTHLNLVSASFVDVCGVQLLLSTLSTGNATFVMISRLCGRFSSLLCLNTVAEFKKIYISGWTRITWNALMSFRPQVFPISGDYTETTKLTQNRLFSSSNIIFAIYMWIIPLVKIDGLLILETKERLPNSACV